MIWRLKTLFIFCLQPDLNAYAEAKEAVGEEAFYADANTYVHGMHKDTPEALERLSKDIKDQKTWKIFDFVLIASSGFLNTLQFNWFPRLAKRHFPSLTVGPK